MKWALTWLWLAGCGGSLVGLRLASSQESSRRTLVALTLPSLDRTDATIGGWGGREQTPMRELILALYGVKGETANAVATDHPVGIAVVRAELPGPPGPVPALQNAVAFTVRDPEGAAHWLGIVGTIVDHHGDLYEVQREIAVPVGQSSTPSSLTIVPAKLLAWAHGDEVILSGTRLGLLMAGPAARAGAVPAAGDLVMRVYPQVLPPAQRPQLAQSLAGAIEYLRLGRVPPATPRRAADRLAVASALFHLRPIDRAARADLTVTLDRGGADLHLQITPIDGAPLEGSMTPVLDLALAGDRAPAALGALDCRNRLFAHQRLLVDVWKAASAARDDSLDRLIDAERAALAGTCSFAVHADDELWSEEASYPLRPGAAPDQLNEALVAAIRSGSLPSLASAIDDLSTAKLLFAQRADGVLALDRVLGASASAETRYAAALYGEATLHDRFAVRADRLLMVSGAHADERLAIIAKGSGTLPVELSRALAEGRGKSGFAFLDLAALWRPFLKAGQVVQSPLAAAVARIPTLIQGPRPLVITLEPAPGLDVHATMPPDTWRFLTTASLLWLHTP